MSREHNIDKTKYQLSHLRSHGSWLDNERFSTDAAAAVGADDEEVARAHEISKRLVCLELLFCLARASVRLLWKCGSGHGIRSGSGVARFAMGMELFLHDFSMSTV